MSPGQMLLGLLESVVDILRNLPLKSGQNRVTNSWDISDMDKWRQDKCHLPLTFHQNRVTNSWNIPYMDEYCQDKRCLDTCHREILLTLSLCGWDVGWFGMSFSSQTQRLRYGCLGVLTIEVYSFEILLLT